MKMRFYVQTGMFPPRGNVVKATFVKPSRNRTRYSKATPWVFGSPYRRIYRDTSSDLYKLYAIVNGKRTPVHIVMEES